jgi:ankyrin repeat protein
MMGSLSSKLQLQSQLNYDLLWNSKYSDSSGTALAIRLLQQGVNPNVRDKDGNTPLMFASLNGNKKLVKNLLIFGVNVSLKNNEEYTALLLACKFCKLNVSRSLLRAKSDPNAQNIYGQTSLLIVLISGLYGNSTKKQRIKIMALLLKYGADTRIKTWKGNTALGISMINKYLFKRETKLLSSVIILVPLFHKYFKGIPKDIIRESKKYI